MLHDLYPALRNERQTLFKIDFNLQQQRTNEIKEIKNKTQYIRDLLSAKKIGPGNSRYELYAS